MFTLFLVVHVAISLVGIASGFVAAYGFVTAQRLDRWQSLFLNTTIATSLTGFLLPADRILPSHVLAVLSLIVLAVAVYARSARQLQGGWRSTYVVTALVAQYFNVFVLVVQSFQKVPALKALAPTQTEAPFAIAQLAVVVAFVILGVASVSRFRPAAAVAQ